MDDVDVENAYAMMKQEILAKAVVNESLMDGTTAPVKRIIDNAQLVFAVWPDEGSPDGIGTLIVKGERRVRAIAASGKPAPTGVAAIPPITAKLTVDAILCDCHERAVALHLVLGEAPVGPRPKWYKLPRQRKLLRRKPNRCT